MKRKQNLSLVAVLGVLSVEPMSGYQVRQAVSDTLAHFWSESFGQIYPALHELEDRGLAAATGPRGGRARRYRITTKGRRQLQDWLDDLGPESPPRSRLLLQLFFGDVLGAERCRELVQAQRAEAEKRLATFAAVRAEIEHEEQYARHRPYWLMTLDVGERTNQAVLEWADATVAALEKLVEERG